MNSIIKTTNLSRNYQIPTKQSWWQLAWRPKFTQLEAVKKINLEINEGESVALLGPNGAGKTTTLKMMTGLLHPTEGQVEVLGYKPTDRKEEFLKQIAMVMGNKNSLSWDLSSIHGYRLYENIYELDHKKMEAKVKKLAKILDVTNCLDRPVRKLSLGQRLKVELIGALLHNPKILFLDEPTLGLDIISKRKLRQFIKKVNKEEGVTVILTSHDMADVEQVVDRVIVINNGKLIFDDSIKSLMKKYQNFKYVDFRFEKKVDRKHLEKYGQIINVAEDGQLYTLELPQAGFGKKVSEISSKFEVDDIDIKHVPLEEIIEDLFKKK